MALSGLQRLVASILALLVLFSSAAPGQTQATDELTRLREENQQLRAENQNLLIQRQPAAPTAPRSAPISPATVPTTVQWFPVTRRAGKPEATFDYLVLKALKR